MKNLLLICVLFLLGGCRETEEDFHPRLLVGPIPIEGMPGCTFSRIKAFHATFSTYISVVQCSGQDSTSTSYSGKNPSPVITLKPARKTLEASLRSSKIPGEAVSSLDVCQ